jgi:hypothetical protein
MKLKLNPDLVESATAEKRAKGSRIKEKDSKAEAKRLPELKRKQLDDEDEGLVKRSSSSKATGLNKGGFGLQCVNLSYEDRRLLIPETVQDVHGVKTLLDEVGHTLRVVKTCQVRGLLGLPVPSNALADILQPSTCAAAHTTPAAFMTQEPTYAGPLLFKVALVSSAPGAGVESIAPENSTLNAELRATDALRAVLANEVGYGFLSDSLTEGMGKGDVSDMHKRRGLLAKALATPLSQKPTVRIGIHKHRLTPQNTLQLSVVDVCGDQGMGLKEDEDPHLDLTGPSIAVSSLAGVQGTVVVVSLTDKGFDCKTQAAALFNVRRSSNGIAAMVLVLLDLRTYIQSGDIVGRGWCEYTASEVASAVDGSSDHLRSAKKIVDELKLQGSKIGRGGGAIMDGLSSCMVVSCPLPTAHPSVAARETLQRAMQILAASAPPTPLICRHRTSEWLDREFQFQKDAPVGPSTLVGLSVVTADPNPETDEARKACNSALMEAISSVTYRFHMLTIRMRALQSLTRDMASAFHPAPDFIYAAPGAVAPSIPGGMLGGLGTAKDAGSLAGGVCDVHQLQCSTSELSDQASESTGLPKLWAQVSRYDHMVRTLDSVRLPWWSHPQPLSEWQAQLVKFRHWEPHTFIDAPAQVAARDKYPLSRAKDVLRALEAVWDEVHATGSVAGVKASVKEIVLGLLTERLVAVMPELPDFFYAVLDKEEMARQQFAAAKEAAPKG